MPNDPLPNASAQIENVTLRILATGDLHAHLTSFDYFSNTPSLTQGLPRVASLIRTARAQASNCLLFDNGDFLQGSVLGDVVAKGWADNKPRDQTHPAIAAFNALKMDAATLGNHDFNFGLPYLRDVLAGANYPIVTSNLAIRLGETPLLDQHLLPPYVILNRIVTDAKGGRHPLRIGVLGVAPPQTILWDHKHLAGHVLSRGIAETVRAFVPRMRAEGADLVVVLAHTGFAEDTDPNCPHAEHAALAVAQVPGIDLMIAGHTHHAFPSQSLPAQPEIDPARGTVAGTPTVMAGHFGSHLGVADLHLVRADGRWLVTAARTEARPIARRSRAHGIEALTTDDAEIAAMMAPVHTATLAHMSKVIGASAQPLHSYFSLLGADACLQVVAEAQSRHVSAALKGTPHEGLAMVSAVAPFRAGGRAGPEAFTDIAAGAITNADIANLYLFPNICSALRVTGADVAEWLEHTAGTFRQLTQGRADQILIDPAYPSYNFDILYGLSYEIDLSQPARYGHDGTSRHSDTRRIRNIKINGRALDPKEELIVVTNDYRASGAGNFAGARRENVVYDAPVTTRDLLREAFAQQARYDPVLSEVWQFRPMPDTSAIYLTGPGAVRHLPELSQRAVTPIGVDEAGFLQLRIAL